MRETSCWGGSHAAEAIAPTKWLPPSLELPRAESLGWGGAVKAEADEIGKERASLRREGAGDAADRLRRCLFAIVIVMIRAR